MPILTGKAPQQVPTNQDLGRMAFQDPESVVIKPSSSSNPQAVGDLVFQSTSDTTLELKTKAPDGTVKSFVLSLMADGTPYILSPTIASAKLTNGFVMSKAIGLGIKLDEASPAFGWHDLSSDIKIRTGSSAPAYTVYLGTLYAYAFDNATAVQEVFNEFHIPHDYVPSSDLYIHAHWSTIAAATGNVNWMFELYYAKGYGNGQFEGTAGTGLPVVIPVVAAGSGARTHLISEILCSTPGGLISSAVNVSIASGSGALSSASALFNPGDLGRSVRVNGAGAAGAVLDTTISAYTSSTSVTLANAASTTITSVPNFKYRVLDTSLIETDGVILARTWHQTNRVADTLTQIPFLHFLDIHYQSTNIATKQRNGPNFWA